MGTRSWLNLGLLLAVVVLAALVYFEPGKEPPAQLRLTQLDVATVQQVEIERDGAETLVLQRRGSGWQLLKPVVVAAKPYYMEQVLGLLSLESQQHYPGQGLDLAKYGLQPPRARLSVDGMELAFGRINPLNSQLYVMVDDVLHMVARNDVSVLTDEWLAYVSAAPLAGVELTGLQLPGLGEIARDEQGWRYVGRQAPQSADQLQMLVDNWQQAQALRVRPLSDAEVMFEIVLQQSGAEALRLGLVQSADELLLQRPDVGLEYVFDVSQSKRLLQWPALAASESKE